MDLTVLLEPKIKLPRLAKVLDELGHSGRLDTIRGWSGEQQAALYDAAKGFHPVTLDHYVPASVGELTEVIHHGKNSLAAFTRFQKRFCRPPAKADGASAAQPGQPSADAGKVLYGYNHQEMSFWTGPGYYVARQADAGEVDIDYRTLPTGKPDSWPAILPNSARLGRFVYAGMVDVMRGISKHVSIGRAKKHGKWMNAWFVLCREDAS